MKKIKLALLISTITVMGNAQNAIVKAPENALLVINYSGTALTKNVPLSKIDTYEFVKNNLFKALGLDSVSSVAQTGIDFEQDILQYAIMEDSANSFVTILPLRNERDFLALLQTEKEPAIKTGAAYKTLRLAENKYLGWTSQKAVLVYTSHTKPSYDYNKAIYQEQVDTVFSEVTDSLVTQEAMEPALEPDAVEGAQDTPMTDRRTQDEEVNMDADRPRSDWFSSRNQYVAQQQEKTADSLIRLTFNGHQGPSIEDNPLYHKTIDPRAPVSIWFNYDNLVSGLWSVIPNSVFGKTAKYKDKGIAPGPKITSGVNLYFDKDKIRLEQKILGGDAQTSKLLKGIFDNKQTASLSRYLKADPIAFVSGSFNTEAVGKYYYQTLKDYLSGSFLFGRHGELADVYIDLLEIVIDEKAIAELMPGNFVMVLHQLNTKQVTYTTYEYDDNFKATETKKTKQELAPDFTIAFETKKSDFLNKLAALPGKYAEDGKFKYTYKDGYYELTLDPEKDAVDHLYFIVNHNSVVVTTSMDMVKMTLNQSRHRLPRQLRNQVLHNNYALGINTDKLLSQINPELSTGASKKIKDYLQQNMGPVHFQSRIKNGIMQSSGTMEISSNHGNSFEFLFNAIEAINQILEEDNAASNSFKL